jgi:phage gpG-like protein
MTGVRLELTVDDGGLGEAMRRAIAVSENLKPILEASGTLIASHFVGFFESQSGPGGVKWIPSKAALGLEPRASGKVRPGLTLVDTGSLRESITSVATDDEVQVGTAANAPGNADRYAAVHEFGSEVMGIPARPFIGFDDEIISDLEDIWGAAIRRPFDGN